MQVAKTFANSVYKTVYSSPGTRACMEMRLIRCVCITIILWFIHLCRLTGYNADSESTEDQGICFEMTSQVKLLCLKNSFGGIQI